MTFNENHAQILRQSLSELKGVSEKRMFGGLCFLVHGNMICGVHRDGGMARVGKDQEAAALEYDGVSPLSFTGRKMGGMVDLSDEAIENDNTREQVLTLAKVFVKKLPRKKK